MPKKEKQALPEDAPAYLKFEESFRPGTGLSPGEIEHLLGDMRGTLSRKAEKQSLDRELERLLKGDVGATEVVARKHEPLAFLVSAGHLLQTLRDAGIQLDSTKSMGRQLAEQSAQPAFRELAERHAMDPLFRKGLHFAAEMTKEPNTGSHTAASEAIDALDGHLNTLLMERTLRTPDANQLRDLQQEMERQGRGRETLNTLMKNQEQQRMLAKMMFLCQLAGVRVTKNGAESTFDRGMGDLIAHGGRLVVNLPAGKRQAEQFNAILGGNTGDAAGVYGRVFATHAVDNAVLNGNGSVKRGSREYKPGSLTFGADVHKNYGMDLAVGGIGCIGSDGKPILPSGQNGHAYMKLMPGGEQTCGAMLFGIETSAPGKSSPLGQVHDSKAIKSKQSPFLSHKQQAGDAYSGRTIDFSQMEGQTFINLMDRFDAYYRALQNDPERRAELDALNAELCGKAMAPNRVKELLVNKLTLEAGQAESVYDQLRQEHVPMQKRVQVAAPEKAPERPNIFKRWLARFSQSWREQNERYEAYVREQQTARLRQRSALDDATSAIPKGWNQGQKTTLRDFTAQYARVAQSAETTFDRTASIALIVQATKYAMAANPGANPAALSYTDVQPNALDLRLAMRDPLLLFMRNNRGKSLMDAMQNDDPCKALQQVTASSLKAFTIAPEEMQNRQAQIRRLYNALNVPDLENRSPEYQELVASVGKLALRESPNAVDSIRVYNSVQNYAGLKRDVPATQQGRESLALAYEALQAALPDGTMREKLMRPMQAKMEKLAQVMQRKAPEPGALLPQ